MKTRWKVLAEIYTMHSFAPFSNLTFVVKKVRNLNSTAILICNPGRAVRGLRGALLGQRRRHYAAGECEQLLQAHLAPALLLRRQLGAYLSFV